MGDWKPIRGTWVLAASWQRFVLKLKIEEGLNFGIEGRKAAFKKAWTANSNVQTASGPQPIRRHFRKIEGHEGVFVCLGCRRLCCWCFGGAPDERCDACVVRAAQSPGGGLRCTESGK